MIYAEKMIIFIHTRAMYKIIMKKFIKRRAEIRLLAGFRFWKEFKAQYFTHKTLENIHQFHVRHALAVGTSVMTLKLKADTHFVLPYAFGLFMDKKLMFQKGLKFHYKMRVMIRQMRLQFNDKMNRFAVMNNAMVREVNELRDELEPSGLPEDIDMVRDLKAFDWELAHWFIKQYLRRCH